MTDQDEQRERVAKGVFAAFRLEFPLDETRAWDALPDNDKDMFRRVADAALSAMREGAEPEAAPAPWGAVADALGALQRQVWALTEHATTDDILTVTRSLATIRQAEKRKETDASTA